MATAEPWPIGFLFVKSFEVAKQVHTAMLSGSTLSTVVNNLLSTDFFIHTSETNKFYIPSSPTDANDNTLSSGLGSPNLFSTYMSWQPYKAYSVGSTITDNSAVQANVDFFATVPFTITGDKLTKVPYTDNLYLLYNSLPSEEPPPCFLAGALVETDQGNLPIETINPATHTIHGKRIIAITQNRSPSAKMVMLPKNCIEPGVPSKDTEITIWHQVYVKGKFIDASMIPGLRYRPYKGEILYNVLMENHEIIKVNNITTKTLPPNHKVARRYRG